MMKKRSKRNDDFPTLQELASAAFINIARGDLAEVQRIEAMVPRVLSRQLDARYRKRLDKLLLAAHRWALERIRGELELSKAQRNAEALAELTGLESYLLSLEAGLEDAAREHQFEADAVRVVTLLPRYAASRPDAAVNEDTRRLAAELIQDVMNDEHHGHRCPPLAVRLQMLDILTGPAAKSS